MKKERRNYRHRDRNIDRRKYPGIEKQLTKTPTRKKRKKTGTVKKKEGKVKKMQKRMVGYRM